MYQLIMANIDVLLATTDQELAIDPKVLKFRFTADNPVASVILANSITLTPGTITVQVEGDKLTVHCLDKSMLDTSPEGTFQRWIRKMEER